MTPEVKEFDTPFGNLEVLLYPEKIHFRTYPRTYLTINRVEYSIRGGLTLKGGEWKPSTDDGLNFTRNEEGYRSVWEEYTRSENARKKFAERVYPLIIDWLTSEEGMLALHKATLASLDAKITTKEREFKEALDLLDRISDELRALQEQRNGWAD